MTKPLESVTRLYVAVLTLVVIAMPLPALALGSAPGDIAAYIVGMRGEVEVFVVQVSESGRTLGRKWIPAKKGYALHLKDRIRTHRGRVRLEFTDRVEGDPGAGPSIFNLGDDTEVGIQDYDVNYDDPARSGGLIDLIRGHIRSFIKGWGGQSGFSVRAGVAVCGIRGTEFTLRYDPDSEWVELSVSEGSVVLTGPGDSRLIDAGQSATMVAGEFLDVPPA